MDIMLEHEIEEAMSSPNFSMFELRRFVDHVYETALGCSSDSSDTSADNRNMRPSVSNPCLPQSEKLQKDERSKKALKKKLKKQRQREKKKNKEPQTVQIPHTAQASKTVQAPQTAQASKTVQASQNTPAVQSIQATKNPKRIAARKKCITDNINEADNDLTEHEESDDSDVASNCELIFSDETPVFFRSAVQKSNKLKDTTSGNKALPENMDPTLQSKTDTPNVDWGAEFNNVDDFKFVKGKRQRLLSTSRSDLYGKDGVEFILKNQLKEALQALNMAIECDSTDLRHYINRGFCYLRLKQYSLAISDAHCVMKNSDDISLIAKAKYQANVAARELQNFEAAEKYLQDSVNLKPHLSTHMELLRLRLTQLQNLGFPEDVSLNVLKKSTNTTEAIILLTEHANTSDTSLTEQNALNMDFDKDETYYSDAEDTSLPWLLLNIAKTQYIKQYGPELQPKIMPSNASNNGAVKKVLPAPKQNKDTKKENKIVNERAVWVGNVTSKMTNKLLQDHFSRFGKVSSVHITQKDTLHYAFVNYESSKAVSRALAAGILDVNGTRLVINKAEMKIPSAH